MRSAIEKKTLTSIFVFIGVTVLIVAVVIVPTVRYILELDRQANELRLLLEKKNEQATHFRATLKQISRIKEDSPNFNKYFFNETEVLRLITTFENLATKNEVTESVVSSNIDSITNGHILISLHVAGEYNKVLSFLSDIEQLPNFITVTKFNLVPVFDRSNSQGNNGAALNIDLSLYASKPQL